MKKKILFSSLGAVVLAVLAIILFTRSKSSADSELGKVKVQRGSIIEKALAVGTIEPENEISVKSKASGVVKHIFADAGTYVKAGGPLLEVKPDPSPIELASAKRQVELAEVELKALAKDKAREETLMTKGMISSKEYEDAQRNYEQSELRLKMTNEALALLESGKVNIGNTEIESIVKAPISGYVLSKAVEVGDPVTPLTSYQEGTVLMKMASMEQLLFKGTVDEIDVGKLKEGMEAEIKVGALPNDTVRALLRKISLKADKKENATIFPIEILIPRTTKIMLRAGYSANANIIIQRKMNVLTLPERVITFRNDSAFVKVALASGGSSERQVKTGLGDAINIEILSGVSEGDSVYEKPVKKID